MRRARAPLLLTGCTALLAILIVAELTIGPGRTDPGLMKNAGMPRGVAPVAGKAASRSADVIGVILGRPLFAASRRPPFPVAGRANPSTDGSMPRLAGIIMEGKTRVAIFQPSNADKPLAVTEGGEIGGRTIVAIAPVEVTLSGPYGEEHLRPVPDASLVRSQANVVGTPSLPMPNRRGNILSRTTTEHLQLNRRERDAK